jgi:hypothetical protein
MTRAKRPILSLIISILGFIVLGLVVWNIPPGNIFLESGALLVLTLSLTLIAAWLIGSTKRGIQIAVGVAGLLIMRRLGILDWLTTGLWLVVMGLVSLFL